MQLGMKKKKKKSIRIGKEVVKLFLFAYDVILHIENPKVFTKKFLNVVNKFSKFSNTK